MTEAKPKIDISDDQPLRILDYRGDALFQRADPEGEVPDVTLVTGEPNPRGRLFPGMQRVGIRDASGQTVGAFNLTQKSSRNWINDIRIEEARRGDKLAVGSYLGVIARLRSVGRGMESDPGGLSDDSVRVWESLVRRGAARRVEGSFDQHGNPKFVSVD